MQYEIPLYIIIFLYGIVIGSFLNVLIYRLPLKENIATERSHCMTCGHKLQWYDLVPLFSWLQLRGNCRYCKTPISTQYPLVEFVNGAGYVLIFLIKDFTIESVIICFTYSICIAISVIDFRTYEIPISLNLSILVLAVINTIINYRNLLDYLIGFCAISGFMLVALFIGRKIKGIDAFGGGDIKLMAFAGLLMGWKCIILAFIIGCILGAIIHSIRMRVSDKGNVLAFGPYLCMGIMIALLFGERIINWYLCLFI